MPVLEFALDATGTNRVQTFWEVGKGNLTILINGSTIGSISQEEFVGGREFPLADGSILKVRAISQFSRVSQDSQKCLRLASKR